MSLETYRDSWKIVKENTLSQGPQIGMYKAAKQNPLLGWVLHQKSEIPYLSGYSLRRHCTGTDVILPKKDSWYVNDLHTIVLLDSEANHTYKSIYREAMILAIYHGKIAP